MLPSDQLLKIELLHCFCPAQEPNIKYSHDYLISGWSSMTYFSLISPKASYIYADSIFSETKKSTHSFVSTLSVWIFPYVMTLSNLLYSQSNSSILFLISAETELSFFKSRISSANISRFGFSVSL